MEKAFLIGDNENLISETSALLDKHCDITDVLDDTVDFIFELTNFNREIKFNILDFIESKNSKGIIVSSSVCISTLEQSLHLSMKERLIGAGLFPTFSASKGIEIVKPDFADRRNYEKVISLFVKTGKETYEVADRPGLISMRVISMIINEAYLVMQEGTSDRNSIDTAMKLGTNYPFGPIEWSERIGIDLIYETLSGMLQEFGDDRYRITPLLKETYLKSQKQTHVNKEFP